MAKNDSTRGGWPWCFMLRLVLVYCSPMLFAFSALLISCQRSLLMKGVDCAEIKWTVSLEYFIPEKKGSTLWNTCHHLNKSRLLQACVASSFFFCFYFIYFFTINQLWTQHWHSVLYYHLLSWYGELFLIYTSSTIFTLLLAALYQLLRKTCGSLPAKRSSVQQLVANFWWWEQRKWTKTIKFQAVKPKQGAERC